MLLLTRRGVPTSITLALLGAVTGAAIRLGDTPEWSRLGVMLAIGAAAPFAGVAAGYVIALAALRVPARPGMSGLVRGAGLLVQVDRTSPVPLYFQVAQALQQVIESGELPRGTRLENEFSLADQLGVSRPTVRQALQHLMDKGLVARKRGVGTSVVADKVRRRTELTSLHDDLEQAGRHPRTKLLEFATVPAPAGIAAALALEPGAPVLSTRRLRYADDVPLAILRNYVRADLGITPEGLVQQGLYHLLRSAGVEIVSAEQSVSARPATAAEATLLEQKRGVTLLVLDRTAHDAAGTAVEHGHDLYLASLYTLGMSIRVH